MNIRNQDNKQIITLSSPESFSAFRMGLPKEDRRNWARHPETAEIMDYMSDNGRSQYVVVEYEGSYIRI
jgi:hypothetical protein